MNTNVRSHRGIIVGRRVSGQLQPVDAVVRGKMSTITYDAVATDVNGISLTNKAPSKRPVVAGDNVTLPEDEPEVEAADVNQECSISVFGSTIRLYVLESIILDPCEEGASIPAAPVNPGGEDGETRPIPIG